LLVSLEMFGQEIELLGQQAQVVDVWVGDAQREVAAQPGAADVENTLYAAGDAPAARPVRFRRLA
jgi:hypothetical protein